MSAPTVLTRRGRLVLGALSVALAVGTVVATTVGFTRSGADGPAPGTGASAPRTPGTPTPATPTTPGTATSAAAVAGQAAPTGTGAAQHTAGTADGAYVDVAGRPVWSDEFTGAAGASPDATWQPATGGDGWGNQELECNTADRDNSALDGAGHLVITARRDPGHVCADGATTDYTSARLSTVDLATMHYGRLRVRAQLPSASGLWPGIWALGADHSTVGWPQSGEIDVAEVVGTSPDTIFQTLHGPARDGGAYSLGAAYRIGRPTGDGFHTYGIDWSPSRITFSVDGDAYASVTRAEVEQQGSWVFDQPFYLLLDVAVGGTFPGPPTDTSVFPQRMLVDFVRVYA